MSTSLEQHVPQVRIVTDRIDSGKKYRTTEVYVDGKPWAINSYRIDEGVNQMQTITLTLTADVTIEHPK